MIAACFPGSAPRHLARCEGRRPRLSPLFARLWPVIAVLACLFMAPAAAHAEFAVCNQTLDVVNIAVGQEIDDIFQTDGWWTVGANQCVNVVQDELANRYIYIYATDVFGHPMLSGTTEMCIERRRFSVRGITDCWQRGLIAAKFVEVDTQDQARWTFFLRGKVE